MGNATSKVPALVFATNDFVKGNELPRSFHDVMPGGPSLTRQEFAAECDINSIMSKYEGHLADPMKSVREPMYVDFTGMPNTLMEAMSVLHRGSDAFMSLPAAVRREFNNDPAEFLDFAYDPDNMDQLREWGLAKPKPPEVAPVIGPVPAPAVPAAPAVAPAAAPGPVKGA